MRVLHRQTIVFITVSWPFWMMAHALQGRKSAESNTSPYGTCGDCFCIPDAPSYTCPLLSPGTSYSDEAIAMISSQIPVNPYSLTCNPYHDDNCATAPPQNKTLINLGDKAVCGIKYGIDRRIQDSATSSNISVRGGALSAQMECHETSSCPTDYRLTTYESRNKARLDGAQITHAGACGVCSTLQDLASYIKNPDLEDQGSICTAVALISYDRGISCYLNLGFTEACATVWVYSGFNTALGCFIPCLQARLKNLNNNGPPPLCELNKCLACDERKSVPVFRKIAGRTRRRSGLLNTIARPCKDIFNVTSLNPCPDGK